MKKKLFLACLLFTTLFTLGQSLKSKTVKSFDGYIYTIDCDPAKNLDPLIFLSPFTGTMFGPIFWPDSNEVNLRLLGRKLMSLDSLSKKTLLNASMFTIDVIGQQHVRPEAPNTDWELLAYRQQTIRCQERVKNLLLANKYPVVAYEGNSSLVVRKEDLNKGNMGVAYKCNCPKDSILDMSFRTTTMISYSYSDMKKMDGIFDLITDDKLPKETTVIGAEDSLIYMVTAVLDQKRFEPYQVIFYTQATPLRSQVALIRIIEYLKKNNQTNGAIVIGSAHLPDFVTMAKMFGIKTNVYDLTK